jgi:hypothetical protein
MPTVSFEGSTHQEIVRQVEDWLVTAKVKDDPGPVEVIRGGADLAKDALRVLANAAPEPMAESDMMKALTDLGYAATDATSDALVESIEALQQVTGDGLVKEMEGAGLNAVYKMNKSIAKAILKGMSQS